MMNKIINFFSPIDIFGKQIQFTYNQKSQFTTAWGGAVSIVVLFLIFSYLYFCLRTLLTRSDPLILNTVRNLDRPNNYTIYGDSGFKTNNDTNSTPSRPSIPKDLINSSFYFQIAIMFEDGRNDSFISVNKSLFNFTVELVEKKSGHETPKNLNIQKCRRFHNFKDSIFSYFQLHMAYCIYDDYYIYGDDYSDNAALEINVKDCDQTETDVVCAPASEIKSFFDKLKIHFYYSKMIINGTNFDEPISLYISKYRYALIYDYKLVVTNYLGANILVSKNSVFPEFIYKSEEVFYALDFVSTEKGIENIDNGERISILIESSKIINYSVRTFSDMFQILGMVGGLSRIFFYLGSIFVVYISNLKFKESMINDFYSVVDPDMEQFINRDFSTYLLCRFSNFGLGNLPKTEEEFDEENGLNRFFSKAVCEKLYNNFVDLSKNIEVDSKGISSSGQKLFDGNQIELLKEIKRHEVIYNVFKGAAYDKMYYSMFEIIMKLFCFCCKTEYMRKKDKIFKYANDKLNKDADFLSIVKSVQELEIFKKIYLSDDQTNLFNLTAVRSFTAEDLRKNKIEGEHEVKTEDDEETDEKERDFKKIKEFYRTISTINKDRNVQLNDKKLLKNLNLRGDLIEDILVGKNICLYSHLTPYNSIWKVIKGKDTMKNSPSGEEDADIGIKPVIIPEKYQNQKEIELKEKEQKEVNDQGQGPLIEKLPAINELSQFEILNQIAIKFAASQQVVAKDKEDERKQKEK